MFRGLLQGANYLLRGFAWFKKKPALLLLGIIPALIVAAVFVTLIIVFIGFSGQVAAFVTPFASGWDDTIRTIFRLLIQIGLIVGLAIASWTMFVAVTLIIGDPFYEKIWKHVEKEETGTIPAHETKWLQTIKDSLLLLGKGILISLLGVVISVVPLVGGVAAVIVTTLLNGRLFAEEITSRGLIARGYDVNQRDGVDVTYKKQMTGFGATAQLLFYIPFGAIFVMPVAVVGGTLMVQDIERGTLTPNP